MNSATTVGPHIWWLASRAAGIVALCLLSASTLLGLAMAARAVPSRPGLRTRLVAVHEHLAVTALVALVAHAGLLLGDAFLHPAVLDLVIPFRMGYRPLATGTGIIAAELAAVLGLGYYVRRRIGVKRWRSAHRLTVVAYGLGVIHTLTAGTDAASPVLRVVVLAPAAAATALLLVRMGAGRARRPAALQTKG